MAREEARTSAAAVRVGFVGLGVMGRPMARNLLAAGFPLTVHSRSPGPAQELAASGAVTAGSPAEVARASDVVITMLPDTPDVESVLFGKDGVAEGVAAGAVVIDTSTIDPVATERFAERLGALGAEMLDAPVSGGDRGAAAGTLSIMVGGEAAVLERCRLVLHALGTNVVHVGDHGDGQRAKLVNQVFGGLHLVALAEGLALARALGLDLHRVLEVVSRGAAGSWMVTHLGPRVAAGDFAPGFSVRLQRKDLRLARDAARERGLELPGVALALERFERAEADGLGRLGTQALVRVYGTPPDRLETGSATPRGPAV